MTRVAFRARHCHSDAIGKLLCGITTAHHRRNAQFARNDGGMTGAPAAVGDDGRCTLHHRFPIRVGHVGDQHIAGLHAFHVACVLYQTHRAGTDLLADGAATGQHGGVGLELVALLPVPAL